MHTFIETYLHYYAIWLIIVYCGVIVAMLIDLIAGLRKARAAGRKTTSRGYKQTCDKAVKYFLPMVCLTCIDIIASAILPVPFMTMAMGVYNIFCELKSILETTHDKSEIDRYATAARLLLSENENFKKLIDDIFELNNLKKGTHHEKD